MRRRALSSDAKLTIGGLLLFAWLFLGIAYSVVTKPNTPDPVTCHTLSSDGCVCSERAGVPHANRDQPDGGRP